MRPKAPFYTPIFLLYQRRLVFHHNLFVIAYILPFIIKNVYSDSHQTKKQIQSMFFFVCITQQHRSRRESKLFSHSKNSGSSN